MNFSWHLHRVRNESFFSEKRSRNISIRKFLCRKSFEAFYRLQKILNLGDFLFSVKDSHVVCARKRENVESFLNKNGFFSRKISTETVVVVANTLAGCQASSYCRVNIIRCATTVLQYLEVCRRSATWPFFPWAPVLAELYNNFQLCYFLCKELGQCWNAPNKRTCRSQVGFQG